MEKELISLKIVAPYETHKGKTPNEFWDKQYGLEEKIMNACEGYPYDMVCFAFHRILTWRLPSTLVVGDVSETLRHQTASSVC